MFTEDFTGKHCECLGHNNPRSGDWKAGRRKSDSCLGAGGFALGQQETT